MDSKVVIYNGKGSYLQMRGSGEYEWVYVLAEATLFESGGVLLQGYIEQLEQKQEEFDLVKALGEGEGIVLVRWGVFSEKAVSVGVGTHFWSTPDGGEVEVIAVCASREAAERMLWKDKVVVGEVLSHLRVGRKNNPQALVGKILGGEWDLTGKLGD